MVKNRISIKENYKEDDDDEDDDQDDLSDDVDDEVFVRDGRKSFNKMDKNGRDKQPLMAMRRKNKLQKQNTSSPDVCNRQPCNIYNCLLPVYFAAATIICLAFLMLLYIFLVNKLPLLVNKLHSWSTNTNDIQHGQIHGGYVMAPCLNFNFESIWTNKIPKLTSETQIKLIDIDRDNVSDIVIGTSVGCITEGEKNDKETICIGGVMAINGKSGDEMWHSALPQVVLALHCEFEINGDSIPDCVVTGRQGLLAVINGANGSLLWKVPTFKTRATFELYNVLIIRDINQDGFLDLLVSHYSRKKEMRCIKSRTKCSEDLRNCPKNITLRCPQNQSILIAEGTLMSEIQVMSGLDGAVICQMNVPSFEPILQAPQILISADGGEYVLFVTGDIYHKGGLYVIPFSILMLRDNTNSIRQLNHFEMGILAAPVIVDINLDGTQDIVFMAMNTVFVVDGISYEQIWNTTLDRYISQSDQITALSSITPAHFDDDLVPDLMVTFSVGSTFLEYLYSVILILNGKSGAPLLQQPIVRSSVVDVVGGITLSFKGFGNDAFVYWSAACKKYPTSKSSFVFIPQFQNSQASADLCRLRFNSTLQLELRALNQHIEPPGALLFSQETRKYYDSDMKKDGFDKADDSLSPFFYQLSSMGQNFDQPMIRKLFPTIFDPSAKLWQRSRKKTPLNSNTPLRSEPNFIGQPTAYNDGSQNDKQYNNADTYSNILTGNEEEFETMIPKVSASGILTESISDENSLDLILLHYEIKSNPACITVENDKKICDRHDKTRVDDYETNLYRGAKQHDKRYHENGNLFVSRNRISCKCDYSETGKNEQCSMPLPYNQQSYPAYGGMYGNFAFKKRKSFL